MDWVISQKWSNVLFINFEVDRNILREHLPKQLEIDTCNSKAYLSIVPFFMSHIRFPFTPSFSFFNLWELNLRTYVKYKGEKGIYFFTLDTNDRLGKLVANKLFHLPYRYKQMHGEVHHKKFNFKANRQFEVSCTISDEISHGDLEHWICERYCLFTINKKNRIYRGDVIHPPWQLQKVNNLLYQNNFSQEFGFHSLNSYESCYYSRELDVKFRPFVLLD